MAGKSASPAQPKWWHLSPRHIADITTALDAAIVLISAWCAKIVYVDILTYKSNLASDYHLVGLTVAVLCLWSLRHLRQSGASAIVLPTSEVLKALLIGFGGFIILGYGFKVSEAYSRGWMSIWFAMSFITVVLKDRIVDRTVPRLMAMGLTGESIALFGANSISAALKAEVEKHDYLANRAEVFDDVGVSRGASSDDSSSQISGDLRTLILGCLNNRFDRVIFCLPQDRVKELPQLANSVSFLPVRVQACMEQPSLPGRQLPIVREFGQCLMNLYESPHDGWKAFNKRGFDLVVGSLILALAAPVMALIALAIKLDSPGPVFFRQRRHGYNHQTITVLKFRSMTVLEDGEVIRQAVQNDSRVTRVGRFLRRTSLDELPQLLNVVRGEMSLVGPRPHALAHNRYYSELFDHYATRHKVKPGITGLAQIHGLRGNSEDPALMAERAAADIEYIENWSIWSDVKILALTPFVVLFQKTAY